MEGFEVSFLSNKYNNPEEVFGFEIIYDIKLNNRFRELAQNDYGEILWTARVLKRKW